MEALLALLCFLVGLAVFLAVVAAVGHGIWLMAAAMFGAAKPRGEDRRASGRRLYRTCAGCGEEFYRNHERCPTCGLDPQGKVAIELKDLEAAARTIQRLRDQDLVSAEAAEQLYKSIEARQHVLLPRRRPLTRDDEPEAASDPVVQLEAWFGRDAGSGLSVAAKQQALALVRTLPAERLRELSALTLVGVARLQRSVGLLTRAWEAYRTLLAIHRTAPITEDAALEALQTARLVGDWDGAEDYADFAAGVPGLLERKPELAAFIEQMRTRHATPVVVAAPAAQAIAVESPVAAALVETPEPVILPMAAAVVEEKIERAPRRSFAEWIGVFMEERNILWGELIGGTLIVGCSIALVISLWTKIEEIEYFPFLLLAAITSALFGAGFYTLHHWKLESTSRGLLLIAMLLTPLDFLVLAGFAPESPGILYAIGVGSLALFSWLLYRSSRILIQTPLDAPMPSAFAVALAITMSTAAQMLAPPLLVEGDWRRPSLYLLSLLPALAHVGALGWILLRLYAAEPWSVGRLVGLLIALGSVTFAAGTTLGFLIANQLGDTLLPLAPALTLVGMPILIAGILTFQRFAPGQPLTPDPSPEGRGEETSARGLWRTLGTALGLAGVFIMFGGFVVSINEPVHRWLCGGLNLGTLLAAAWVLRVPALHVMAQVYLAVLIVIPGKFEPNTIIEPHSALNLIGLLIAQTVLAEALTRWHRRVDALFYAIGGAVSTVLAILVILPDVGKHPDLAAIVFGSAAFVWYGADLRWRHAEITYVCSLALGVSLFFATRHFFEDITLVEQVLWSLLAHATISLAASIGLRFTTIDWVRDVLRIPLQLVSLGGTFAISATILIGQVEGPLGWPESSIACGWLAALWLTIAVLEGWPILFAAFQVALGLVWIFGIGGWLTSQGWDWREPYAMQVYALGLGTLGLGWELTRLASGSRPRWAALLSPDFVPVDRAVTSGLIVAQYLFTACAVVWSVARELSNTPDAWRVFPRDWHENAFSAWAWLLLLPLAGALVVHLRQRVLAMPLIACTIMGLTLPLLAAGTWFDTQIAAASAVRWGLVLVYAVVSLLLWYRHRLRDELADQVPAMAIRLLMVGGAIVPLLWITLVVVADKFTGPPHLPRPVAGLFFAMDASASLLIPLGLLSAILAGHGFRERLAYYLLATGLLIPTTSVGTYVLGLQMANVPLDQPWVLAGALLVGAGVAWLWSIAWTWVARLLEPGDDRPLLGSPLLALQGSLGDFLFGSVLLTSVAWIIGGDSEGGRIWTQTTGSVWGWLVYALMAFGSCFYFWTRRASVPLHLLGVLGLTAVGMIACSVEVGWPEHRHSLVALMFGSALFACVWVWSHLFLDARRPPRWLKCDEELAESVIYALVGIGLAVWLACGTFVNAMRDPIWSANSIVLAAAACVLLAYQRKTEVWTAFASVLTVLASTIFVLHIFQGETDLWLYTIQIDVGVFGAMSLLRLGLHRFLAIEIEELRHLRLLPIQIGIGLAANALLLFFGLMTLVVNPARPGWWLTLQGFWPAWLALATNAIAAVWYVGVVRPRWVVHAVACCGLMLGIALAGTFEWREWPEWLAHHVLTLAWTVLGVMVMVASWIGQTQTAIGPQFWDAERRTRWADALRTYFREGRSRGWVTLCGGFVVALALRAAWIEPGAPYWNIGNTLGVSLLLGMLAIWARTPIYVYGSGLLFNVIGGLIFFAWWEHRREAIGVAILSEDELVSYFVLAQILSFAAAAMVWSLLEWRLHTKGVDFAHATALPFTQAALTAGIHLLAIGVGLANGLHLQGEVVRIGTTLAWIALGALAVAALCELWRFDFHRFTRYQLYTCGLLAIGLFLHDVERADWLRHATLLLSGYVLLIVTLARLAHAQASIRDLLRLPASPDGSSNWFWHVQLATIALVVGLSAWLTLTEATLEHRFAGALACAIVTVAAYLLVHGWPSIYPVEEGTTFGLRQRAFPCWLVLTLGLAVALEACWAMIDPLETPAPWLQRSAAALAVLAAGTLVYRFVLARCLGETLWAEPGRTLSANLGVLSMALLLILLGQEFANYSVVTMKTPLLIPIAGCSGVAILGLAALALVSALTKEPDAYGIEGDRRSAYVYLAEFIALLLVVHLRLNLPALLPPVLGRYWFISVMVLAFVGIALSEFFTRKTLPVLAIPLFRSAMVLAFVPVLGFGVAYFYEEIKALSVQVPGLAPFAVYLEHMANNYAMHATCWLLLGIFLGSLAPLRKSANYGILAALAINFGFWVLLNNLPATSFLQRPQLWLIPLGVIVLVAEFVNREQLGFWPSLSVRYAGLLCIYLSSTIEMFKDGIGRHEWLPIVLASLAVLGMLLGILFRVRAFLLSGFLALLVVVFAMIWHAAVVGERMWVWWACGIGLGVIILIMFAVFEKHRNGVIKVIDNMKRWN